MLVGAALLAMLVVIALSDLMRLQLEVWWVRFQEFWFDLTNSIFG